MGAMWYWVKSLRVMLNKTGNPTEIFAHQKQIEKSLRPSERFQTA